MILSGFCFLGTMPLYPYSRVPLRHGVFVVRSSIEKLWGESTLR